MEYENFLSKRKLFAEKIGFPNLYEFIDHYSLFAGSHTICNKLWTYDLLKDTVGVPGDIYEFGCWKGSNLMFLAKVHSLLESSSCKRIYGFDNFSGLPEGGEKDGNFSKNKVGKYHGDENLLRTVIDLFDLSSKINLVIGDALRTIPKFIQEYPESICSFAYLDFDLYEPTKKALEFLENSLSVGGVIVFDEAGMKEWPGETIAMKEFLKNTSHRFKLISNTISIQPTIALKRIE